MLRTFVELCHTRQKMELELRGKVLIVQERAWAQSTTLYVPPGGFDLERKHRRDRSVLYVAGARIFGLAAAEAILYACWITLSLTTEDIFHTLEASTVALFMVGLPIFSLCLFLYALTKFSRPIPSVRLDIRNEEAGLIQLEFWHRKDASPDVTAMVQSLEALASDEHTDARIAQLGFFWQTMPPLRHGFYQAISWSFALVIALQLVRFLWRILTDVDLYTQLPDGFLYIFVLPWALALIIYGYHRFLMRQQPEEFRQAIRLMFKEKYDESAEMLTRCMEEHPDHMATLGLLIQLHVRQFNFEGAFQVCNTLERSAPEAAQDAQENIWIMKRLQAYMDEE